MFRLTSLPRSASMLRRLGTAASLAAVALLTACGGTSTPTAPQQPPRCKIPLTADSLVLVVPVHRGAASGLWQQVECTLEEAGSRGASVSVVTVEGEPKVLLKTTITPTGANPSAVKANLVKQINTVNEAVNNARATSEGTDLLEALAIAADTAANAQVISFDPGLNDRGLLDFTKLGMLGLDEAGMDEAAAHVAGDPSCRKYAGRSITLVGLGHGVEPQPALRAGQRATVGSTYATVLEACGATVQVLDAAPVQPIAVESDYSVNPVDPGSLISFDPKTRGPLRFDDASAFGFRSDSVDFRNTADASQAAKQLVAELADRPEETVTITGTTSNGPTAWPSHEALGKARAEAVKQLLERAGLPNTVNDQVTTG